MAPPLRSTVSVSFTSAAPTIETAETLESGREETVPSIESSRFVPFTRNVISCALPAEVLAFHAAGGEGPLPGTAAGSEAGRSAPCGVCVAPSACVEGVDAGAVLVVSPDDVPLPPEGALASVDC